METVLQSIVFVSMIVVFGVDATRKRREFLKKQHRAWQFVGGMELLQSEEDEW